MSAPLLPSRERYANTGTGRQIRKVRNVSVKKYPRCATNTTGVPCDVTQSGKKTIFLGNVLAHWSRTIDRRKVIA